jgi:hypothetical protein
MERDVTNPFTDLTYRQAQTDNAIHTAMLLKARAAALRAKRAR